MTLKEIGQTLIGQLVLVDMYKLDRKDIRVRDLVKAERRFKKTYKVDIEVVYIDTKHKDKIVRSTVKGYRHHIKNQIVVFVDGTKRNIETLYHELTHEYQNIYMNKKFLSSKKALADKKVSYKASWHETHARHCATLLVHGGMGLDLRVAMDYTIAA